MTRVEKEKSEILIDEAFINYECSQTEWEIYESFKKEGNSIEAEIHLRRFQDKRSFAEGIYQVLAALGFKHPKMKEFSELL